MENAVSTNGRRKKVPVELHETAESFHIHFHCFFFIVSQSSRQRRSSFSFGLKPLEEECTRKCGFGGFCDFHPLTGSQYCSCNHIYCSKEYGPVCGNDGFTYPNECTMQHNACFKQRKIMVAYKGRCSKFC